MNNLEIKEIEPRIWEITLDGQGVWIDFDEFNARKFFEEYNHELTPGANRLQFCKARSDNYRLYYLDDFDQMLSAIKAAEQLELSMTAVITDEYYELKISL